VTTKPHSHKGFTLVEIMIVVAIIGILVIIAVPGFLRARERSRQIACQENLYRIDDALQQYVIESNVLAETDFGALWGADWTDFLVGEDSYIRALPICQSGGVYSVYTAAEDESSRCSLSDRGNWPHRMPQVLDREGIPYQGVGN
jgi:prepilin-type N-terminal cleavage/methylation domain-containing protein